MSSAAFTMPVEETMPAYHGTRRNAVADIFQDVDVMTPQAPRGSPRGMSWESPRSCTMGAGLITSYGGASASSNALCGRICHGTFKTHAVNGCISSASSDGQNDLFPGSRTTGDGIKVSTCSVNSPCVVDGSLHGNDCSSEGMSWTSLVKPVTGKSTTTSNASRFEEPKTKEQEKKAVSYSPSYGEAMDSLHIPVVSFRPDECAKRSLIF